MRTLDILDKTSDIAFKAESDFLAYLSPKTIYHYSNTDALYNIFKSNEIWLTDSRYLNDRSETINARKIIAETIEEESANIGPVLKSSLKLALLESDNNKRKPGMFLASFSKSRDLLSQWKGYAPSRSGVCIGFDPHRITANKYRRKNKAYLFDVLYSHASKRKLISHFLNTMETFIESHRITIRQAETISHSIRGFFETCSVCFKDPSWTEEQEVRLVILPGEDLIVDYKMRSGYIIPFARNTFKPNIAIKSITHIDESDSVHISNEEFLRSHNCSAKVKKSEIEMQFFS